MNSDELKMLMEWIEYQIGINQRFHDIISNSEIMKAIR